MGGVSVGAASTDYGILARDMFGLKLKIVNGYKSSNDVKLAMERGEVQGAFANGWSSLRNAAPEWIRDGKIRIIVQHGFKPLPELPDVPLFISLAQTDADRAGAGVHAGAAGGGEALFRAARPSGRAACHPAPCL